MGDGGMSLTWLLIRGSGLAAFGLLGLATIWGLLLTTGVFGRAVKAKSLNWFHESLSIGALIATVVHMVALANHDYIEFTLKDLLVPGSASYERLAVSWGVMAFYALFLITASFYVKKWIGQTAWRLIHFLAFGTFLAALLHGIIAGTDSGNPYVVAGYAVTVVLVTFLTVVRVLQANAPARPERSRTARQARARSARTTTAEPAGERAGSTRAAGETAEGRATPRQLRVITAEETVGAGREETATGP